MRRAKYILFLMCMIHATSLTGQSRGDLREMFVSAEGDLLFEDYAEALPKYLSLLQIYPENYNLFYRIGQCYLHTPGEKEKAIAFLETASQNIDPEYRRGKLRETGAPYDVLYFLANAYRISNDFDRAVETYELFLRDVNTEMYDTSLVRFQIETCHNAGKMMRRPSYIVEKNLGSTVNSRFSDFNPVISSDEKTLLFTRELPFYDAIFWSTKVNGKWSEPVNLTPQLGIDQDYYTSSISHDGKTLLLYKTDTYDGNIYQSTLRGDTWSNVEKLNANINTKYWESHAVMSQDGRRIFFTSNRRESLGGLDIFMAERDSTGDWGAAVNLGSAVNSVYNEETPFLANNDRTLFFSSRGHYNMGGYDIFRSDLDENGNWGKPVNAGYPLNTTDDDIFFSPAGKGNRGYLSRFTDEGVGRMDIMSCDIYSGLNPRNFIIMGRATVRNLLDIEVLSPDSVITTERQQLADSAFTYSFVPEEGRSDVTLQLTDRFGNQAGTAVTVIRSDAPARREVPLYHEIPVRPTAEPEETAEEEPDDTGVRQGVSTGDTLTFGAQDTLLVSSDDDGDKRKCRLWWLLPVAALIILFLILKRRKETKTDKDQ
jgi:hypothetical protein